MRVYAYASCTLASHEICSMASFSLLSQSKALTLKAKFDQLMTSLNKYGNPLSLTRLKSLTKLPSLKEKGLVGFKHGCSYSFVWNQFIHVRFWCKVC